ncbi:MAG: hypothetical protein F4087_05795 [Gemmatimonadetes bacterium]|nr:hypothetical protein [Gemmatimonadota bacterium]MDE2678695.1 hypothetical protein [Gemmatimonadota bacterium]MXX33389.1 hypothetical protein [Gemmatimonadota bacterium]MYA12926.1 hypothetical protein [Gemmatimonadota bacterium]MYD12597.1 hypothetical protein [Gemmatimonadota bacterium]
MKGLRRLGPVLLAVGVVAVAYSCGDGVEPEPPPPDPAGFLRVSLTLNRADVGALIIRMSGDPLPDSIRGAPGLTVYDAPAPQSVRAFVAGPLPDSGTVLQFWTSNANLVGRYSAWVEQAAGTDYEQLLPSVASVRVIR